MYEGCKPRLTGFAAIFHQFYINDAKVTEVYPTAIFKALTFGLFRILSIFPCSYILMLTENPSVNVFSSNSMDTSDMV